MERQPVPPRALLERPVLAPSLELYVHFFNVLSPSRQLGHGVIGNIPVQSIISYLREVAGITDPEELDYALAVLQHMDAVFCEVENKRATKEVDSGGGLSNRRSSNG